MLLLGDPLGSDALVPFGVVDPRLAGRHPAALHAAHRAVDVEHLQQQLERRAADVDHRLERGRRDGLITERREHALRSLLVGHGCRREVVPDVTVLGARQQEHIGALARTPRAADLLVVRHRRRRGSEMEHEAQIGFVEAHPQRTRRDERLDLIALEHALEFRTLIDVGLARVRAHVMSVLAQQPSGVDRRGDSERVDDAGARQIAQMAQQPGEALRRVLQAQHAQAQRRASQWSADREHRVSDVGRVPGAQLLGHIGDDAAVRRRGGREHRYLGRHLRDQVAQPAIVGAEVVAPVADAVRLVDHQHPEPAHQVGQLLGTERRVVEALGRDEQHIDLVAVERCEHVAPLVRVGGVDRDSAHAHALGRGDLVAHEREQRRHQHGGPCAPATQQERRDEVHGRLAPSRALHDERAPTPVDQRLDGLELSFVEVGIVTPDELAQGGERVGTDVGCGSRGHTLHSASRHRPAVDGVRQ